MFPSKYSSPLFVLFSPFSFPVIFFLCLVFEPLGDRLSFLISLFLAFRASSSFPVIDYGVLLARFSCLQRCAMDGFYRHVLALGHFMEWLTSRGIRIQFQID